MSGPRSSSPLIDGLIVAMRALDSQVAREMQRTPAQEETMGVQKWGPYQRRVEELSGKILDLFAERTIDLDSILILSQALPRVLALIIEELGQDGLGKLRSAYCDNACAELERFITRCRAGLDSSIKLN